MTKHEVWVMILNIFLSLIDVIESFLLRVQSSHSWEFLLNENWWIFNQIWQLSTWYSLNLDAKSNRKLKLPILIQKLTILKFWQNFYKGKCQSGYFIRIDLNNLNNIFCVIALKSACLGNYEQTVTWVSWPLVVISSEFWITSSPPPLGFAPDSDYSAIMIRENWLKFTLESTY